MERQHIHDPQQFSGWNEDPAGIDALREAQEGTDTLLRAADNVISKVLSRDNAQFMRQAQQHSGE